MIALLLLPGAAGSAQAQRLHDPGGNRIESFHWSNQSRPDGEPIRHCSRDRIWCAELHFPRVGERRPRELRVVARATNRDPQQRRWRYTLPDRPGDGFSIWSEIVRDWWGGALIGIETWQTTGARPGFFSNQRRLLLLHIPSVAGGEPYVVLETPLSGYIEQPMCPRPTPPPGAESVPLRVLPDEEAAAIAACEDRFEYSTLLTLLPSSQPADQPPDLIVATVAQTSPGRRLRTPPGTRRDPIPWSEGDVVRDPACTFTRTYYFDAATRRYRPDVPLPACRDYLEP